MTDPTTTLNDIVGILATAPETQLDSGIRDWCRKFPDSATPDEALVFLRDVTDVIVHIGGASSFVVGVITGQTGMCLKETPEAGEVRRADLMDRFHKQAV